MAALQIARGELGRLAGNGLRSRAVSRGFGTSAKRLAAQNFAMPALSPTMTEGNISKWHLKEGDTFQPGDVILEVETDKASMDVEAQDEGILAKIMQQDGSKGVQVGARIAVLAEPGDDIASLEIPEEDNKTVEKKDESAAQEKKASSSLSEGAEKEQQATAREGQDASAAVPGKGQKQNYPLYPSVAQLLHENGLDKSDADKIPASGPSGRLLKGDVLSYLGTINASYSSEQSQRIAKLGHLDLSNIKLAPKKETPPAAVKEESSAFEDDFDTEVAVSVSFKAVQEVQQRIQKVLGIDIPLETFITRAIQISNTDLPRSNKAATADELFNDVLGLDSVNLSSSQGTFSPELFTIPTIVRPPPKQKTDIIDILAGKPQVKKSRASVPPPGSVLESPSANVFSLVVEKGEEKRARVFLERVKTILQVDPGRLVL